MPQWSRVFTEAHIAIYKDAIIKTNDYNLLQSELNLVAIVICVFLGRENSVCSKIYTRTDHGFSPDRCSDYELASE